MAQSLRQLKSRIHSVESIWKMTRAMEMVSVAKLRSLQKELSSGEEFLLRAGKILRNLLSSFKDARHPLLQPKPDKHKILLCLITSDTGLCGSYNSSLIRAAEEFIRLHASCDVSMLAVGRKGLNYLKKSGYTILDAYTQLYGHYSFVIAERLAKQLLEAFVTDKADEVYAAYMHFTSAARHCPRVEKILNIEAPPEEKCEEYIIEPDIDTVLDELIPLFFSTKIKSIMLNAFTTEHATRIMAMHEATNNAKELFGDLTLLRNKMRQADITREIIEVISSADALKG